jgi:hypothetical protein
MRAVMIEGCRLPSGGVSWMDDGGGRPCYRIRGRGMTPDCGRGRLHPQTSVPSP